jgi:hypothetical protein
VLVSRVLHPRRRACEAKQECGVEPNPIFAIRRSWTWRTWRLCGEFGSLSERRAETKILKKLFLDSPSSLRWSALIASVLGNATFS